MHQRGKRIVSTSLRSDSDDRNWWRISWYGKKAIALYAVIGLMIAVWQFWNGNEALNEPGQDSTGQLARDTTVSEPEGKTISLKERVLVGETVTDLRSTNNVRDLSYEEQTIGLSRLSGIWGVGLARVMERNARVGDPLMEGVTLQNDPQRWRGVVEIHKTVEGIVSIVGFVEEGSVARLLDESRAVGSVYFYHEAVRAGLVPVAIPASRVAAWDYREPHEFSELVIDADSG